MLGTNRLHRDTHKGSFSQETMVYLYKNKEQSIGSGIKLGNQSFLTLVRVWMRFARESKESPDTMFSYERDILKKSEKVKYKVLFDANNFHSETQHVVTLTCFTVN